MRQRDKTIEERFWEKVQFNDCWIWTGKLNIDGYGRISFHGKMEQAHRIAWMLETGFMSELCILHRCDERKCVRFDHLFEGTQQDNLRDMRSKGRCRSAYGEQHHSSKLTVNDILEIRNKRSGGQSMNSISKEYGVSYPTIRCIIVGKTWKSV